MFTYILRRGLQAIPVLFVSSFAVFYIIHLVPGDPTAALAGPDATPEQLQELRDNLGFSEPLLLQYFDWLKRALSGDLGRSYVSGRSTISLIQGAMPVTLQLVTLAIPTALLIGVPLGIAAGVRPNSVWDGIVGAFSALTLGIPDFVIGVLYLLIFSLVLGWLPPGGYASFRDDPITALKSTILPVLALAAPSAGIYARFVREGIRATMREDFVRTARAKGLVPRIVIIRHVLRLALLALLTVIGVQFGRLIGGSIIIETVFAWPGMGRLTLQSIQNHDYFLFQGIMLILVAAAVGANLIVDVMYGFFDPRIRLS